MSAEEKCPIFDKLADGVIFWSDLNDVSMSIKKMIKLIVVSFNNEDSVIKYLEGAYEFPNFEF